ncbi:MAG TPA: hypothetical protein DIU14_08795 [Actinobacteria bacterium]|jgi:Zn-dependent protease|nr:hypothetical protein [Actinomycetota bacterium]
MGMLKSFRIGRVGGVEIRADSSLAIIAILITIQLYGQLTKPGNFPGLSHPKAVLLSVASALLFFASILGHELAHAAMFRARHIPVSRITLFMFGGATQAKIEARVPADEFLVSVVGPLTSLAIGGLFLLIRQARLSSLSPQLEYLLRDLGVVNVTLAIFNLVPGFPLDGGRVLRSIVWKVTGSPATATKVSARVGQIVGLLLIGFGILLTLKSGQALDLWLALIGWLLYRAATATLMDVHRRQLLEAATAGEIMAPPPPTVPADMPVAAVMQGYLAGHDGEAFPVMEDGRVVGFVSLRTAQGVSPDRPAREAMLPPRGVLEATPGERMDAVAGRMEQILNPTVLVVDEGRLVGVIEPEDLSRYMTTGTKLTPQPGV